MSEDILAGRVAALIAPTIKGMGYDLVRVSIGIGDNAVLQIMAEPDDGGEMNVDHCVNISRAVSAVLDVEDPIKSAYTLEVSSPGLDRPLVRLADYDRFAGFEAKIQLKNLMDGRKKFKGRVDGTDGNNVLVDISGEQIKFDHGDIAKAKLIVTDEMLAKLEEEKQHE